MVSDVEFSGPVIIPNKCEITLRKGQNYTLYCRSNKLISIEQQEIPEEMVEPFHKVQRNVTSSDNTYKYEIALDLYNVNQFTVGYYACFDFNINSSDIFRNMLEEPVNTDHISYIYIYVDGEPFVILRNYYLIFLYYSIFLKLNYKIFRHKYLTSANERGCNCAKQ